MAGDQLNRERRALLGAALALPAIGDALLSRHPELGSGSSSPPPGRVTSWTPDQVRSDGEETWAKWHAALAAYRAAEAAVAGEEGRMAGAAFAEAEAAQEGYDQLGAALDEALARLFAAPAPDLAALAAKLQLFAAHEAFTLDCGEAALEGMVCDARRLAGVV
jgi:hypothetical protein